MHDCEVVLQQQIKKRKQEALGWLGVTLVTVIMKCCLLYSEQCCRLPGTLPLVVQILLLELVDLVWCIEDTVLVRERYAIRVSRTCTSSRTSTIRSFAGKVLFKVRALLPLVRESERVLAREQKRDWKRIKKKWREQKRDRKVRGATLKQPGIPD